MRKVLPSLVSVFHPGRRVIRLAAALCGLAACITSQALADETRSPVARYSSEDGEVNVVLDRTGPLARLQFHGSREFMYLEAVPATRGDIIMQNGRGQAVLRISSFGGVTYFGDGDKLGVPVFKASEERTGASSALYSPQDVKTSAAKLASMVSTAIGQNIEFQAEWPSLERYPASLASLNGAVENVAFALRKAARRPNGRVAFRGSLKRVQFVRSETVGLHSVGETLYVKYANTAQADAHPSVAKVMSFLQKAY